MISIVINYIIIIFFVLIVFIPFECTHYLDCFLSNIIFQYWLVFSFSKLMKEIMYTKYLYSCRLRMLESYHFYNSSYKCNLSDFFYWNLEVCEFNFLIFLNFLNLYFQLLHILKLFNNQFI